MADSNPEVLDYQHSDSEFEKVAFPGEDETVTSDNSASDVRLGSSAVDRERVESDERQSTRIIKPMVDEKQDDQEQLNTKFEDLIYWCDVRWTSLVFGGSLLILTSIACCSLLSLILYTSLFVLTFTFACRLCGNTVAYFKKSKDAHPLDKYLEKEISIPLESVHSLSDELAKNVSRVGSYFRRLYLVERFVDSIKFALLLWLMTFIGSWFSAVSLLIIGDISIFTVPKFYSVYQKEIDECLALVNAKLETMLKVVQEKVKRKKTD